MAKLIVMCGPPCSGKSTLSKKMLKENKHLTRVNKDSFRWMLRNEGYCHYSVENIIEGAQIQLVHKLLDEGKDVILDNTHCKVKYMQQVESNFKDKAVIEVILLDVPYWQLLLRNVWRCITQRIWIPKHVIKNMKKNFADVKKYLDK